MKKTIKHLITGIVILVLSSGSIKASKQDTTDFIVNGIILKTNKKLDSKCKVELFYENKLVDESIIKLNKPFEYKLKRNVWYTLRVTKEGFLPLSISFNTELENNTSLKNNLFSFETALIDLEDAKLMNDDLIDFPVGHVAYNKETHKFEARDIYTDNYLSGLYKNSVSNADIVKEYVTRNKINDNAC